jgi:His-Xaa-Ser system protein HxsD
MKEIILNEHLYSLETIFNAAYSLIDKAYFLFDKLEDNRIVVKIEEKSPGEKNIVGEFQEALLLYLAYKKQAESTKEIRTLILKRALLLTEEPKGEKDANQNK